MRKTIKSFNAEEKYVHRSRVLENHLVSGRNLKIFVWLSGFVKTLKILNTEIGIPDK
jgi:hypothetical protein